MQVGYKNLPNIWSITAGWLRVINIWTVHTADRIDRLALQIIPPRLSATLKSIDYNVAVTFILNHNATHQ